MASSEVYVSFGGDTAGLEASIASANAAVRNFARELSALASEQVKAGASAESEIGQKMLAVARELDEAKKSSAEFKEHLKEGSEGGEAEGGFLARMKEGLENLLAPINDVKANFGEMIELVAAAFAVEKIADWVSETTEAAEKFESIAASMGVGIEQVQQLGAMAKLSGTDFGEMQSQLERLQLTLAKAGASATPAAAALKVLGLNAAEFRTLSPRAQVNELAEAFSKFADGAGKTAVATALLGKAGADLIPFLDKGKEGIDELNATIERTGVVMSGDMIESFAKTREGINELSVAWTALSQNIYSAFNQPVQGAVAILNDLIESLSRSAAAGGSLAQMLDVVAQGFQVVESAIVLGIQTLRDFNDIGEAVLNAVNHYFLDLGTTIGMIFKDLAAGIPAFFGGLLNAASQAVSIIIGEFKTLGSVITDVLMLRIGDAKAASGDFSSTVTSGLANIKEGFAGAFDFSNVTASSHAANAAVVAAFKKMNDDILGNARAAKSEYQTIWGSGRTEAPAASPTKPQVPMMDLSKPKGGGGSDDTAVREAEAEAEAEVDAAKRTATAKEKLLDEELKTHGITMSQWLAQTTAALTTEEASVKQAYDKELQTAGLTSVQIINIKRKEADAIADIEQKIRDAQAKAAEEATKNWDTATKSINSAFESQIDGLLTGTESFRQAFKNVLKDLTEQLIKFGLNKLLTGTENSIGAAAGIPGANANAGLGSVFTSLLTALGLNTTATTLHTTATTVGTAATTAGTAANVAGTSVQATNTAVIAPNTVATAANTVATQASSVFHALFPFFAEGTPFVKDTGLAVIHQGEAIIPAAKNPFSRGGLPSFDIGAWKIPDDMVANVHRDELVMPAGQAGAFRDLLSGAGGGGGGRAVSIHPTVNMNLSAIDGASAGQYWRSNSREVLKVIEESVRHGAHLGLRRLGG